jgi:hypothetical protein
MAYTIPPNNHPCTLIPKMPSVVRAVVPREALTLTEESWNAFPCCRTVLISNYFPPEKFKIDIQTWHLPDAGLSDNVHGLGPDKLKERVVIPIDIAAPVPAKNYVAAEDPTLYQSVKTGRGRLQPDWLKHTQPIMTCYKLVQADFRYWGLQGSIENVVKDSQHRLFTSSLRQAVCLMDEWFGLTMADIRRLEEESKEELARARERE